MERTGLPAENVSGQVLMGCVLPAGQGQAPARQAALERRPDRSPRRCHHRQQDVRLRHEDGDAGP
ncbi:MAG: hypothetical protein ACWGHV_01400 [Stutzerimonas stutzeri]